MIFKEGGIVNFLPLSSAILLLRSIIPYDFRIIKNKSFVDMETQ